MADIFTVEKRSAIMKNVKPKGNKTTELQLVKYFKENSIKGWMRNYPVKGHPDFVFLEKKIAIFVDGCFWHGHDCRNTKPKQNENYWANKIKKNKHHDQEITELFQQRGWKVIRIWECELKKKNRKILEAKIKPVLDITD